MKVYSMMGKKLKNLNKIRKVQTLLKVKVVQC